METVKTNLIISKELDTILDKMYSFSSDINVGRAIIMLKTAQSSTINYIGVAEQDKSKISYLTKSRIDKILDFKSPLTNVHLWDKDNRTMAKPSKVLKQLLPDTSDVTLEKFASFYKMQTTICDECLDTSKVVIVRGTDIQKYYLEDNYLEVEDKNEGESPLWQSCMRYNGCQEYLEIYSKNSAVSMAIFLNGPYISCRCLLWTHKDTVYYDRIYATSSEINRHMQACLEKMNFINISYKNIVKPSKTVELYIQLEHGQEDLEYFPYADTMNQLDGKILSNVRGSVELNSTEGDHSGMNTDVCNDCGEEFEELHEINIGRHRGEDLCQYCCQYSEYHDDRISNRDGYDSDFDGYILNSEKVVLHDDQTCHEDNAICLHDGTYCHKSDNYKISEEGQAFLDGDENYVEIEENWYNIKNLEETEKGYKLMEHA